MHILNESLHIVVLESHAYALLDVVVNVIIYVNVVVCQPILAQLSSGFRVGCGLTTCLFKVHVRVTTMLCIKEVFFFFNWARVKVFPYSFISFHCVLPN